MLIFFQAGMLGNQCFQYAFLKSIAKPGERIVLVGMDDLFDVFDDVGANQLVSNRNRPLYLFRGVLKVILRTLAAMRIISSVRQRQVRYGDECVDAGQGFDRKKGLFDSFTYVLRGWFQSESFFDAHSVADLRIRQVHLTRARAQLGRLPPDRPKAFVHVRRGNYEDWTVCGASPLLPRAYFERAIGILKELHDPWFVFVTNDRAYIESEYAHIEPRIVVSESPETDFAVLTLCDCAVLSNSSFSWWGAWLMRERGTVIAPRYWFGHRRSRWIPEGIAPSFAQITDVD